MYTGWVVLGLMLRYSDSSRMGLNPCRIPMAYALRPRVTTSSLPR